MSGGKSDKRGNWYEEDNVLWHLLLVADEQEESLLWEGDFQDGQGVDCWVRQGGKRIAMQFKTATANSWSTSDLAHGRLRTNGTRGQSVLAYAIAQLQRDDADKATDYSFVSNRSAPSLESAIAAAHAHSDPVQWFRGEPGAVVHRAELVRGFGLNPEVISDIAVAHATIIRMRVQTQDHLTLRDTIRSFAEAFAASPDRLIVALRELARDSMVSEIRAQHVRSYLTSQGVELADHPDRHRVGSLLETAMESYEASAMAARRLQLIPRSEADDATRAALSDERVRTIIVHGPAGIGKTEVVLQTVLKLRDYKVPTLVIRADQADHCPLGIDPVRVLNRFAAGQRACLIIDQLDQVVLANERAQHLLTPIMRWVVLARLLNVSVIVGCRTVDVDHDTQLKQVLCPDDTDRFRKIPVHDLSESVAAEVLSRSGIAIGTIHPDLLPLTRRPLVLHLLMDLAGPDGAYMRARTIIDLVILWWNHVREPHGIQADGIFNAFASMVEHDGKLTVDRAILPHQDVVRKMVTSGVLIPLSGSMLVRPFHQVVIDVWLARQWSQVHTLSDVMNRIGDCAAQDLHHARRLRLTVQLFASRGHAGATLCDKILRSADLRPLLKRAMLIGISSIDHPDQAFVRQVEAWLDDDSLHEVVRTTAVYDRVAWMDALDDWVNRAWHQATPARRNDLMSLLAPVSRSRGDLVARHLQAWSTSDPTILSRAQLIFWHDPSQDSDELFEMRLRFLAESPFHDRFLTWKNLLIENPVRAIRLFAYHLDHTDDEGLMGRPPDWFRDWPATLPPTVENIGVIPWQLVQQRWNRLIVNTPLDIRSESALRPEVPVITCLVDVLATSLSVALAQKSITWKAILSGLPAGNRFIDSWLLLKVGSLFNATTTPSTVAQDAITWFMGDPALTQLGIGRAIKSSRLAEQFLQHVAPLLDDDSHRALEQWLIADTNSAESDLINTDGEAETDTERLLIIRYRLLAQTDRQRWSPSTAAMFTSLEQSFTPTALVDRDSFRGASGWVRSDIPDNKAMDMTCEAWIRTLLTSPQSGSWTQSPSDSKTILSSDINARVRQLQYIVPHQNRRFRDGLSLFIEADQALPQDVLPIIIEGIARMTPPDRPPPSGPWEPLDDESVASIFSLPVICSDERFCPTLVDVVRSRSAYSWSDDVISKIISVARGDTHPGIQHRDGEELITYRLNEWACRAVETLAEVSRLHPQYRERLLTVAEELSHHADPGRRASAGILACLAQTADPRKAFAIILEVAANPVVAGEHDIGDALLFLAGHATAPDEQRLRAKQLLLGLINESERLSRQGGRYALILRDRDLISPEDLQRALHLSAPARQGAASLVAVWLRDPLVPKWIPDLALDLANDDIDAVGDEIMHVFYDPPTYLLRLTGFFTPLVRSKAAKRNQDDLLNLCAKSADLISIADDILLLCRLAVNTKSTYENQWRLSATMEIAMKALQSLVATAEQNENNDVRCRALDTWDLMIEKGQQVAQKKLNEATDFGIG